MNNIIRTKGGTAVALRRRSPPDAGRTPLTFDSVQIVDVEAIHTDPTYSPGNRKLFDARTSIHRHNKWRSDGVSPDAAYANMGMHCSPSSQCGTYWWGGYFIRDDLESLSFDASYGSTGDNLGTSVGTSSGKSVNAGFITGYPGEGTIFFDGCRVHNSHDAVVIGQTADPHIIVFKNWLVTHNHDDAFQNDNYLNNIVQDCLVDGTFVFYSIKPGGSSTPPDRSATRLVVWKDNVVRMKKFPGYPSGSRTSDGHGRALKSEAPGTGPGIYAVNNVIVYDDDQVSPWQSKANFVGGHNNYLIWTGAGAYPWTDGQPDGWTLIEHDLTIFNSRKTDWLTRHSWSDPTASGNGATVTQPDTPYTGPYADGIHFLGAGGGSLTAADTGEILIGGRGSDILTGGAGEDVLYGGPGGPNRLNSGSGPCVMHGSEAHSNTFAFQQINGSMNYVWGFGANDALEICGVLTGYAEEQRYNFIRFVDTGAHSTLEVRYNGVGLWVPLAWIAGGAGLTPAGLGVRLAVT